MELARDFSQQLSELNQLFQTDFAIISHIDQSDYMVLQVASELDSINVGQKFVTKDTYCNIVVDSGDTVIFNQVGYVEAMKLHPVYTTFQLESYIGHPLHHNGVVVGTLNFSGFEPKDPPFNETDKERLIKLAKEIELELIMNSWEWATDNSK